jgi:uncharacterized membrane protein YfhO
VQAPDFDPLTTVILLDNEERTGATPYGPLSGPLTPGSSQATLSAATSSALTLQVNAAAAGFLVLSELWYPGWQATVQTTVQGADQTTEQAVIHANGSLRAIPIPAGESTVELHFRPLGWRWGQALAGLGIIGVAVLVWSARRTRSRQNLPGSIPSR